MIADLLCTFMGQIYSMLYVISQWKHDIVIKDDIATGCSRSLTQFIMVWRSAQQAKKHNGFLLDVLLKATFLSGSLVCGCYIAGLAVFEGIFTLKDRANKPRDCSDPFIPWLARQSVRTRLSKSERWTLCNRLHCLAFSVRGNHIG